MNDEPNAHCQTWDLIPWVVNGTATRSQRERVESHLRDCIDCRNEFALQQQFHAGLRAAAEGHVDSDPQPALQRLFARLDAESAHAAIAPSVPSATAAAPRRAADRWTGWLAAAVVVQAIGLALLGGVVLGRPGANVASPDDPAYRTLSSGDEICSDAVIRLVVAPDTTLDAVRRLLGDTQLRIVEGSADTAALALAPRDAARATDAGFVRSAVAQLRAMPGVVLAEPIAGSAGGRR